MKQLMSCVALVWMITVSPAAGQGDGTGPEDIRMRLEGTWELVEWHVDGEVLRPPEVGGRWLNHDGVVVATFHRASADGFESFTGYGTYEIDASRWSYTYERVERAQGASPEEAVVTVVGAGTPREFSVRREGDAIVLEGDNDRREYTAEFFSFMPNGQLLRKYRKVVD